MIFASRSISVHILRGVLGFAAVCGSLATLGTTIWPSVVLLPAALFLLKGCPMCWAAGLIETITISRRKQQESTVDSRPLFRQPPDDSCCRSSQEKPA
jgi:hypothetical protein